MPLTFGVKKSESTDRQGDGEYLRNFRAGDTVVRFLEEPRDWWEFREHYNASRISYPCTGDRETCPGCNADSEAERRAGKKYGTYVHLVKSNKVVPMRIPVSLNDRLTTRAERNEGTLLSRDYVVIKSGKGMDTEYDVDQDDKYPVDVKDLLKTAGVTPATTNKGINEILAESYENAWGEAKQEEKAESPTKRTESPSSADQDVPDALKSKEEKKDEELEVSEAELKSMTRPQLEQLYEKAGFGTPDEEWSKSELVKAIIEKAGA